MLQEQEEEHLCALMSKWKRKGEDMRERGCWQPLNVLLLHTALLCSLPPPARCWLDAKLLCSVGTETACGGVAFTHAGAFLKTTLDAVLVNPATKI